MIGRLGWHAFRHTYQSMLRVIGTPLGVQKDLMRHASISTTMNVYGGTVDHVLREANSQVVSRVLKVM